MRSTSALLFATMVLPGVVPAAPTALNLIPTADVLDERGYTLQFETDGYRDPFAEDADLYVLTQVGVGEGLEVGLDAYAINHEMKLVGNAKWQVLGETKHRPGVAVGTFSRGLVGSGFSLYLAATGDVKPLNLRATGGTIFDDGWRWMVGFETYPTDNFGVLVDWTSGPGAWATLGLSYQATPGLWITPYYAWNNTSRDSDFFGLNFYWESSL